MQRDRLAIPFRAAGGSAGDSPLGRLLRDPGAVIGAVADAVTDWLQRWVPLAAPAVVAVLAAAVAGAAWRRRHIRARLSVGARVVTVLSPPTVDPAGGLALWGNLVGLLRPGWRRLLGGQPHVVFEYLFSHTGASLQLWVPGGVPPGLVERAVEAAWPGAHTRTTDPTPPVTVAPGVGRRLVVTAARARLAREETLPIRTEHASDPIRALLSAAVGLAPGEQACLQVLARPVAGRRARRARHLGHPRRGRGILRLARAALDVLTPGPIHRTPRTSTSGRGGRQPGADPRAQLEQSGEDRAIVAKTRGPLFETQIRYAVTTTIPTTARAAEIRKAGDRVRGVAHAIGSTLAAYSDHNRYQRRRLSGAEQAIARRALGRGDLLSVPELAAVAHLPTDAVIAGLQRAGARAVAPPPGIATAGAGVKTLGTADTGRRQTVGLHVADARHHLHVLGATGSGKSTLLARMILEDVDAGRGTVVIDPKGDLVTDILTRLPKAAGDRVVLFDADAKTRPPCLNPLDGGQDAVAVDNLVAIWSRIYAAYWGPRTDDIFRAACLTLRAQPGTSTLVDLPKLLGEDSYRDRAVRAVTDEVLRGFWAWFDQLTEPARAHAVAPLLNKLRGFLFRPFVRSAIAGGPSTVDMRQVIDEGGICLARIPKGTLGEDTTKLVGSILVSGTWQAATARADTPQPDRPDASLVIDECHNFLNLPYPMQDMLAEARGYRLSMTLAHQHLAQLPRELGDAISTNARSKIYFTTSPDDARALARHTTPTLGEHDLAHLGAYTAAARLISHGADTPAFTLTTLPLPPAIPGRAAHIRAAANNATTSPARRPGVSPAGNDPPSPAPRLPAHGADPRRAA